jgi:hypothetical protein
LDSQENTLMAQEDDLVATESALGWARMEGDIECEWAEAFWQDYQAIMHATIISASVP